MLKTEQFYELDEDIISEFKEVEKEFSFAFDIKYSFLNNNKLKKLIEIKKIPDSYAVLLGTEVLVTMNEDFYGQMDKDIIKILWEQEIDKIEMNMDKGTIKLAQSSLKTSTGLCRKYTYDNVERANETQRLLAEQKKDKDEE